MSEHTPEGPRSSPQIGNLEYSSGPRGATDGQCLGRSSVLRPRQRRNRDLSTGVGRRESWTGGPLVLTPSSVSRARAERVLAAARRRELRTMSVGFIGAGQLACALARGFTAAGKRMEAGGGFAGSPGSRVPSFPPHSMNE
ncbi:hypothetical protein P7K49_035576 [Saguinus oedipus]|uniref:Pyrroline-5-carboxylate reductase catalytic N-terminal domain-containing protein n=1 Tax=Saguinus oedipus TaxID=9490 RepID=A0ABQ9TNC0_SAGOE|nr:hypothetical protein P7K49_035576 [Saguinus oedipus]